MIISLLCDAAVQVEWRRLNKQLGDGYRDGGCARTFVATCSTFLDALASLKTMFKINKLINAFKILSPIVLESITECYRVLSSVTECYRVLQSITEYYRVLQSITEYNRV